MRYDIISINHTKDKFYDIKYKSRPWFAKSVELTERFEDGPIVATRVRDWECFHNLKEVIRAFDIADCGSVNFEEKNSPLPQMQTV